MYRNHSNRDFIPETYLPENYMSDSNILESYVPYIQMQESPYIDFATTDSIDIGRNIDDVSILSRMYGRLADETAEIEEN